MQGYYCTIRVLPFMCYVTDQYKVKNITGPQYCFTSGISGFDQIILPVSLFNGKYEGDLVSLPFEFDKPYRIIVTCSQYLDRNEKFERVLYDKS